MTGKQLAGGPPKPSFRNVLSLPGHTTWYLAVMLIRAPVVMAPLALVFVGYTTGSFALGGMLAAAHALGEAAGAPVTGRSFDTKPFVRQLRLSLGVEAAAFATLALTASHAPVAVLLALTFTAGAAASGAPGGMRAQLSSTTPEHLRPAALGLESSLSQSVWAIAPPLTALLYAQFSATSALLVMAVLSAAPAFFAHRIPHTGQLRQASLPQEASVGTGAVLKLAWPTALLSASIMFLIGTADVLLPARLKDVGASPALAGPVMTAFAVASVAAGLLYGSRRWPGTPRIQTLVLLLGTAAAFALPGLTSHPWSFTAAFAFGGLLYSPLMIIRNLALQKRLPQSTWATGFSVLYAAAGLGYGAAGLMSAAILRTATAGTAFLICTLTTTVIGVVSLLGERLHRPASRSTDAPADTTPLPIAPEH